MRRVVMPLKGSREAALAASLVFAACTNPGSPLAPLTEPTTPPVAENPPSPVCSPSDSCGCFVRPPGEGWQPLAPCAAAPTCAIPQGVRWRRVSRAPEFTAEINGAMKAITGCEVRSDCRVRMGDQEFFAAVAAELRKQGLCAGQHDEGATDEVAVGVDPGEVEGHHVYNYGGGRVAWAPGSYRDTWIAVGE